MKNCIRHGRYKWASRVNARLQPRVMLTVSRNKMQLIDLIINMRRLDIPQLLLFTAEACPHWKSPCVNVYWQWWVVRVYILLWCHHQTSGHETTQEEADNMIVQHMTELKANTVLVGVDSTHWYMCSSALLLMSRWNFNFDLSGLFDQFGVVQWLIPMTPLTKIVTSSQTC